MKYSQLAVQKKLITHIQPTFTLYYYLAQIHLDFLIICIVHFIHTARDDLFVAGGFWSPILLSYDDGCTKIQQTQSSDYYLKKSLQQRTINRFDIVLSNIQVKEIEKKNCDLPIFVHPNCRRNHRRCRNSLTNPCFNANHTRKSV